MSRLTRAVGAAAIAVAAMLAPAGTARVRGQAAPALREEAIQLGSQGESFDLILRYEDLAVTIRGPLARIARAAREARVALRPFSTADVTEEMASDLITFTAVPAAPAITGRGVSASPRVTGIALASRGRRDGGAAVLPLRSEPLAIEWLARGERLSGQGIVAYYTRAMFPAGPFDVLVTVEPGSGQPRRATVTSRDRFRIR